MPDDSPPDDPDSTDPSARHDAPGAPPPGGATGGGVPDGTQAMSNEELAAALAADDLTGAVPASSAPASGASADPTRALASTASPTAATHQWTADDSTPPTGHAAPGRGRAKKRAGANRAWIAGLVAVAVLLAGAGIALALASGHGNKSPKKSSSAGAPDIPASTAPPGPPCPLTGLPSPHGAVPQRPALAIKVDNYPQARPQSGINQADIVYEEPVEGGITRLVAVFQCQSPSLVGPVRSARAVDVEILDELSNPLFIHAGGIDPVLALLQEGNLIDENVFTHGSIVQTPPGRNPPYDTYVSASSAWGLDPGDTTPPTPVFTYSTTTPSGTPVTSIHIPFSSTNNTLWTWNASSGTWLLSYSGTPATVANAGQISTANVVVQTVQVSYGPWLENNVGGYEVQSKMTGSGPLMVLRNGIAVSGTWSRPSLSDPTTLTASDGTPITLQPGPTWVEIVPSGIHVTTTSPKATTATTS